MKTFKDTEDREWTIEVNVTSLRRVRDLTTCDILGTDDGDDIFMRLAQDPFLLCDVLYALCKPQADARTVVVEIPQSDDETNVDCTPQTTERPFTDEDFGRAMAGDAIANATDAFLEEFVNFCPSARKRKLLATMREKQAVFEEMALARATEMLGSPEMERKLKAEFDAVAETLGATSTSSPESSGSTLGPEH